MKLTLVFPLLLASPIALALTDASSSKQLAPSYTQSMGSMLLALGAVIAVLLLAVWLGKKVGIGQFSNNAELSIKSHLALSQKEKLVVVEYRGKQILLGVAPGCVNCIDVGEQDVRTTLGKNSENTNFASKLMAAIKDKGKDKSQTSAPNSEEN